MTTDKEPLLSVDCVSKVFSGTTVLRDVSFELGRGQVLALAGENGAGKSTVLSMITGLITPDRGRITYRGCPLPPGWGPASARAAGIASVHQELSLNPHQSVAENVLMGSWPSRLGVVLRGRLHRAVAPLLQRVGLSVDPGERVARLTLAQQQLVELAKALSFDPQVLLLDEATSALDGDQVAAVYRVVDQVRVAGGSVVVVSHRLQELLDLADRFTVLKDGEVTADRARADLTTDSLVRLMLGRELSDLFPVKPDGAPRPGPMLTTTGLSTEHCHDLDLELPRGRVVGLGGMQGQGQREVLRALFGLEPHRGRVELEGQVVPLWTPQEAISRHVVYVPEDRKVEGVHVTQSVRTNLALPSLGMLGPARRLGTVDRAAERRLVSDLVTKMRVKVASPQQLVSRLSGGNQQKVAIAKWLTREPHLLLLAEPTRGIDVGTKREIYHLLRRLADDGLTVLVTSGDTMELVGLCDEVAVMFEGRVVDRLSGPTLTEENLVRVSVTAQPLTVLDEVPDAVQGAPAAVRSAAHPAHAAAEEASRD